MNCIETLAQLQGSKVIKEVFLKDTKSAYARMVATEEVSLLLRHMDKADEVEEGIGQEGTGLERDWDSSG